jgi:hypothetical protein
MHRWWKSRGKKRTGTCVRSGRRVIFFDPKACESRVSSLRCFQICTRQKLLLTVTLNDSQPFWLGFWLLAKAK